MADEDDDIKRMAGESDNDFLGRIFAAGDGETAFRSDPRRAYDGQPHTTNGVRGMTMVEGLTLRDIRDCLIRAYFHSADPDDPGRKTEEQLEAYEYVADDVYKLDFDKMDPIAIGQNLSCEIERAMGTFPNLPDRQEES